MLKMKVLHWQNLMLFFLSTFIGPFWGQAQVLSWQEINQQPLVAEDTIVLGRGGSFSGIHQDALLLVGGTNFRDLPPWRKGKKTWYQDVRVFRLIAENRGWVPVDIKAPQGPCGYGASVSTDQGVFVVGGENGKEVFNTVWRMQWDPITQQVTMDSFPSLPFPLRLMSAVVLDDQLYVAGGMEQQVNAQATKHFLRLSLTAQAAQWEILKSWPGEARILPVLTVQGDGLTDCLYLTGGVLPQKNKAAVYLQDHYKYHPQTGQWTELAPVPDEKGKKRGVAGAPSCAIGAAHVAVIGGLQGRRNNQLGAAKRRIAELRQQTVDSPLADSLEKMLFDQYEHHPGFSKEVLLYHTITDTWVADTLPIMGPIGTPIHPWQEGFILPPGEIKPGVRNTQIYQASVRTLEKGLTGLNLVILALYFLVLIFMGLYFSRRQKNSDDYFKGGGRIPWWAAALSLFGTGLSAITFMAVPAKTFATDWAYFMRGSTILLIPLLVNWLFIPYFRKVNITSAYEYLEMRFNKLVRLLGSLSFLIFQIGRLAVVLFLPSIALNVVTGIDINLCILLMGGVSVLYTFMGGIEAVIWTDVLQVVVLAGGGLLCFFTILGSMEDGIVTILDQGVAAEKFELFNWAFDFKQPTIWVVVIGGFFSNLIVYSSDQTMVQRYLTTKDTRGAQKSLWTNAIIGLFSAALFFFIGTSLFVYYQSFPHLLAPEMKSTDAIFPWFIISQLPDGISGLLIAGIFAAAMSSLSSSMNSAATVYTVDFHSLMAPSFDALKVGRIATLIFGVLGTAFALYMAASDIKSAWDAFLKVVGLITGGLGGLFLLGIISRRANGPGAIIGLLFSVLFQYWVSTHGIVHFVLYTATGFLSCLVVGYLASFLFTNSSIKQK